MFARSRAGLWVPRRTVDSSQVSLLLNFNGADGDYGFTDESPRTKAVSRIGYAYLSSSQKPAGVNTALFPNSGGVQVENHADLVFAASDFTVEAFIFATSTTGYGAVMAQMNGTAQNSNFSFQVLRSGAELMFDVFVDNTQIGGLFSGLVPNTWQFVTFCRSGGYLYSSAGGAIKKVTAIGSASVNTPPGAVLQIGQAMGYYPWGGYIGPVRTLKGVGLYTSDFTPPAPPLTL